MRANPEQTPKVGIVFERNVMNRSVPKRFGGVSRKRRRHLRQLLAVLSLLVLAPAICRAGESQVNQVIVVFKTHFDIGYTDLVTNVLTRYRTTFLDRALQLIEGSRALPPDQQFVWTVPGWPLRQMLWPGQTPERRQKVLRALKEGRLALHALPFTVQTESLDLEDLVRGLRFSADLARENGLPLPRAAKMTDVPEHCWILPTLLANAGITFLHIGCNGGSKPMQLPPLFWWVGPDGSRVLTAYSPRYGTDLVPPPDWPYHTWLAMIMTGDNHGPPSAAELSRLMEEAKRDLPGVKIKLGRLEDFYDAIMAEDAARIPSVRGDMPDTWIHGFEAMPIATKLAWDARPLETALGTLNTELCAAGLATPSVAQPLAEAYENSLLYSEHTFGFSGGQPGGFWYGEAWRQAMAAGKYDRFLQSFEDKRNYIRATARIVTNALNERLTLLAQNVRAPGPHICVFNPLPWKRTGEVEIAVGAGNCTGLEDLTDGARVKRFSVRGSELRFLAEDVPASGYKTFKILNGKQTADSVSKKTVPAQDQPVTIQNQTFRLELDPKTGRVSSLRELKTGRELVAVNEPASFGQYLHERFSLNEVNRFLTNYCRLTPWAVKDFGKPGMPGPDQVPYGQITVTNWVVTRQEDAVAQTLVLRSPDAAPLARAVTLKYTLYAAEPYLDIEWRIEDKTPEPLPEGGWLCFPFAIEHPQFTLARLGSLTDPAKDVLPGANRHLFCLNSGMTIVGPDGFGVGLCPLDSPLVSLDEPGLWKFSMNWVPKTARVYVNLYNNQWDTNFPLWQQGSWSSRVRLWVVRGGQPSQDLLTPAWEARTPLVAGWAERGGGRLPPAWEGLSLSRDGVLTTCFGPDPYSDQILLRIWEVGGRSGPVTVKLPARLHANQAFPVNLRGEPKGKPIRIRNNSFIADLHAFSPASFRLEPAGRGHQTSTVALERP